MNSVDSFKEPENQTRVLYEWEIFDPRTGVRKFIDFAFTDAASAHLSWLRYRGGLELKVNPKLLKNGSNTASGTVNTLGKKQALSRSASCIFACLAASDWVAPSEGYQVCTCYADARCLGVARVSVDANMIVTADVMEPVSLPGYQGTTEPKALLIVKHLLLSPTEKLRGLVCSKPSVHMHRVMGRASDSRNDEEWELGPLLGVGGFAVVYCGERAGDRALKTVIKLPSVHQNNCKLLRERDILSKLVASMSSISEIGMSIPRCIAFLEKSSESTTEVIALRLEPIGVPVPKYLRLLEPTAEVFTQLVRYLGPALVRVLRAVHSKGIAHRDVRPTNFLIVPPVDAIEAIVLAGGDILLAPGLMKNVDLGRCNFVLNDWGEAEDNSREESKLNDLKSLVTALRNPINLLDLRQDSTGSQAETWYSGAGVGPYGSAPFPSMAPETACELKQLATSGDYEELEEVLRSATFTDPPPAP